MKLSLLPLPCLALEYAMADDEYVVISPEEAAFFAAAIEMSGTNTNMSHLVARY